MGEAIGERMKRCERRAGVAIGEMVEKHERQVGERDREA